MSSAEQLRNQIIKNLQTLKREIDRLSVREAALLRCRRLVLSSTPEEPTDEEEELQADVIANIEAIEYDLTTPLKSNQYVGENQQQESTKTDLSNQYDVPEHLL